jgi:hypothetical protein
VNNASIHFFFSHFYIGTKFRLGVISNL